MFYRSDFMVEHVCMCIKYVYLYVYGLRSRNQKLWPNDNSGYHGYMEMKRRSINESTLSLTLALTIPTCIRMRVYLWAVVWSICKCHSSIDITKATKNRLYCKIITLRYHWQGEFENGQDCVLCLCCCCMPYQCFAWLCCAYGAHRNGIYHKHRHRHTHTRARSLTRMPLVQQ